MTLSVNIDSTKENRIAVVSQIAFQYLVKSLRTAIYLLAIIPEIIDPSNPRDLVPNQYHNLLPLFTKKEANKLPPY